MSEHSTDQSITVFGLLDGDLGSRLEDWFNQRRDVELLASVSDEQGMHAIPSAEPALVVSAGYHYIVPAEYLEVPELGAVNCHYSYLPYNRGYHTNVWSIIDDHPAGVTTHYMADTVDTGDIIARRKVPIHPDDDGRDLYHRLINEQFSQFTAYWPMIRDGPVETIDNPDDEGTCHYEREFDPLCELDLEEETTVNDCIDKLRALTFEPYKNAYFEKNGTKYYVEVDITPEDDL